MNDNNFTNNTYIGTYLGGFHGLAKLLLFDKNFNVTDEILKMENQKMQNDSSIFGLQIVQGNNLQ